MSPEEPETRSTFPEKTSSVVPVNAQPPPRPPLPGPVRPTRGGSREARLAWELPGRGQNPAPGEAGGWAGGGARPPGPAQHGVVLGWGRQGPPGAVPLLLQTDGWTDGAPVSRPCEDAAAAGRVSRRLHEPMTAEGVGLPRAGRWGRGSGPLGAATACRQYTLLPPFERSPCSRACLTPRSPHPDLQKGGREGGPLDRGPG